MLSLRRSIPLAIILMSVGALAAADKTVVGVIAEASEKGHYISVKEGKAKTATPYAILKETDIVDEKGKKIGQKDLEKMAGKDVTLTLEPVAKTKNFTLSMIKLGKPEEGDKKDGKKEVKKSETKSKDPTGKGTEYTIVSVDAAKGVIVAEADGEKVTFHVGEDTKFVGPKGGDRGEGRAAFADNDNPKVLSPGFKIRVVIDAKGKLKEVNLPYQNSFKE